MAEMPQIDEIIKAGRARERRIEIVLGLILVAGGLAFVLGMNSLTGGTVRVTSYGAVGVGVILLGRGLFGRS